MPQGLNTKKSYKIVEYDFNNHGGEQGEFSLGANYFPKDAIIDKAMIDVMTAPVGSGASISFSLNGTEIKASTSITSFAVGLVSCEQTGSVANAFKTTESEELMMEISGADLTAGRMNVIIEYYISD